MKSSSLSRTFLLPIRGCTIGLACLNTVWRATGAPNNYDHGKLILGERQIDNSSAEIAAADFKIAVFHHPHECWADFEKTSTRFRIYSDFDLACFGHNHDPNPELVVNPLDTILLSNAGTLFTDREYYNGYTIIILDFETGIANFVLRTYFDRRRAFDKAVDRVPEGTKDFPIRQKQKDRSLLMVTNVKDYIVTLRERFNQRLISSTSNTEAPKELKEILSSQP